MPKPKNGTAATAEATSDTSDRATLPKNGTAATAEATSDTSDRATLPTYVTHACADAVAMLRKLHPTASEIDLRNAAMTQARLAQAYSRAHAEA